MCYRVMKNFSWGIFLVALMFMFNMSTKALTAWKYEDWQDGSQYGTKTKIMDPKLKKHLI